MGDPMRQVTFDEIHELPEEVRFSAMLGLFSELTQKPLSDITHDDEYNLAACCRELTPILLRERTIQDGHVTDVINRCNELLEEGRALRKLKAVLEARSHTHETFFIAVKTILVSDRSPAEQFRAIAKLAGSDLRDDAIFDAISPEAHPSKEDDQTHPRLRARARKSG